MVILERLRDKSANFQPSRAYQFFTLLPKASKQIFLKAYEIKSLLVTKTTNLGISDIVLDDFLLVQPPSIPIMESLREIPVVQCLKWTINNEK